MESEQPIDDPHTHEFIASVVIARPRQELYAFCRNFVNAPLFMERVDAVTEVDSLSSVWTVKDASGNTAQWEMLVTEDEPDRLIAWSTSGHSPVSYSGRLEFQDAAGEAGTEVSSTVRHQEHPGVVETLLEAVGGVHPERETPLQSPADLDRLKRYMENLSGPASSRPAGP